MKNIFLISILAISSVASAITIPSATDYDLDPKKVFLEDFAVPMAPLGKFNMDYARPMSSWDVSQSLDWQALSELNEIANQAWVELQKCYAGRPEKMRAAYLSSQACAPAAEKIKALHSSVSGFLSSTMALNPAGVTMNQLNTHKLFKGTLAELRVFPIEQTVEALPNQSVNPLLIQALLEFLASGYPLNYGTYECNDGALCALRSGNRYVTASRRQRIRNRVSVSYDFASEQEQVDEVEWAMAILDSSEKIPVLSEEQMKNPNIILLRQAATAVRILNQLDVGQLNCSDWGLWPKMTVQLIGDIAQSNYFLIGETQGRHSIGGPIVANAPQMSLYPSDDLDFLAMRLSVACEQQIHPTLIQAMMGDSSDVYQGRNIKKIFGDNYVGGPEALSVIGAWRKLLEHQL